MRLYERILRLFPLASYEEALPKLIKAAQKANENKTREEIPYAE